MSGHRKPPPCEAPSLPHTVKYARLYVGGWLCDRHSPWAVKGLPEPQPGPGLPVGAWTTPSPLNDSRVHDARAVASGKRRSTPQTYRVAQAAVDQRKDPS